MESQPNLSADERRLVEAAVNGDAQTVREMLGKGVSPNVRDSEKYPLGLELNPTPLMCAAAKGHVDVVRALLEAGADVSAVSDVQKADGGPGSQALHHALSAKHVEIARLLLDAGADPNAVGRYGRSPLTTAVASMSPEAVDLMLARGADVKLKPKRKDYDPPLYTACGTLNGGTVMVMRNGKLVPAISAVWERKAEVMAVFHRLIAAGADPNAPGPRGQSPLYRLVAGRDMPDELQLPLVTLLLQAGARPDLADKDGTTPLRIAELYKNQGAVELLQEALATAPQITPVSPAPKPKGRKTKTEDPKPSHDGAGGTADFLKLMSQGEDEWAILAIKAPIDAVTDALGKLINAKNITRDAARKADAKGDDEIAPVTAVVEVANNPWTIALRSLFYLNAEIAGQAPALAERLSRDLKTSAIAFISDGASPVVSVFEKGRAKKSELELEDDDAAEEFFSQKGIYLPACYVKGNGQGAWLTTEEGSSRRITRADLLEV